MRRNVALGGAAARAHENRTQDTAGDRQQMRHEHQRDLAAERGGDFLFHLRDVPMIADLVCAEVFVDLGEKLLDDAARRAPVVPDFASMMIEDGSTKSRLMSGSSRARRRSESIRELRPAAPREAHGDGIRSVRKPPP